ncbi:MULTISPECIES: Ger(x)C family spore germination protein [unclassified Paenibacillus]|uniref:Ger(x)C family spore germination protein n=1 Tax=unclassified Paenibacillus TaxID=185978 RepID=UPI002F3FF980
MSNKYRFISVMIALLLLTSCGDQRILEKTGFIQSTSYDLLPNGKLKYTVSIPIANPDIQKSNARLILNTETTGGKKARIELAKKTNLILVSGQLRTALFGIPIAKEGLMDYMDTLKRDPTIAEQVKIVVVNEDAGSLLSKDFPENPRTGKYIDHLIEKESLGQSIPETTIYSFSRDYYDDGIDPIAPVIRDAGNSIAIDGIALFKDDKYVSKIQSDDAVIFFFLKRSFIQGEISIDLTDPSGNTTIMLSALNSSRKLNVKHEKNGQITVNIQVNALASLLEYNGDLKLGSPTDKQQLENIISEMLTERAKKIIKQLQSKKTDNLGIGIHVRNSMSYKEWKKMNWQEQYPDVVINCVVNLKIKEQGFLKN